jgi:hypothetical protein
MEEYIAFDSHKRYTWVEHEHSASGKVRQYRLEHAPNQRCPERHVSQLYFRLRQRKGHGKAVGAVARHLAEAAFHVLSRQQAYRDPTAAPGRTTEVEAR